MGNCVGGFKRSRKIIPWNKSKTVVFCVIGLEGVGKSTIVKALQGGNLNTVTSTNGFSRADFEIKKQKLVAYDLGGADRIKDIWKTYYPEVFGVVLVIDGSAHSQMNANRQILAVYAEEKALKGKPLLVLLNKKDLPDSLEDLEFSENFQLHDLAKKIGAGIRVESVCGVHGTGSQVDPCIVDGFEWLIAQVMKNYAVLEKGVDDAIKALKARQQQERIERQHRLAMAQKAKKRALQQANGHAGENGTGNGQGLPRTRLQKILSYTKLKKIENRVTPDAADGYTNDGFAADADGIQASTVPGESIEMAVITPRPTPEVPPSTTESSVDAPAPDLPSLMKFNMEPNQPSPSPPQSLPSPSRQGKEEPQADAAEERVT